MEETMTGNIVGIKSIWKSATKIDGSGEVWVCEPPQVAVNTSCTDVGVGFNLASGRLTKLPPNAPAGLSASISTTPDGRMDVTGTLNGKAEAEHYFKISEDGFAKYGKAASDCIAAAEKGP
jgi:hypothetical protein